MRKVFSILFVLIILVSAMRLSFAEHICGGKIAAVKFSVTGALASCGMEYKKAKSAANQAIADNCCHNELTVISVDNYNPVSFEFKNITQPLLNVFAIPSFITLPSLKVISAFNTNISPPDNPLANSVGLADICIFRI
jgi:hypothetical protein